ncbi:LysR family transcriptional regulator [uncultured Ruminococcus sp.]|uniref:LysR family transcriptional regulator n=1 Tax=uncultured Ruminococcus sp. TaxID=165186 RepID=UPI0025FF993C|nr:LysR family transcriptional regulator [uncultured Ruminococcus sp.]
MTILQMHYALTICECGSMNKAAEKLGISQPTLTSAVRELEKELRFEVFMRSHKGAVPSAEGLEFLQSAGQLLRQYELIQEKYISKEKKRRFGISTQHYSFAVSAFINTVKQYNTLEFEFAVRETETLNIIRDVAALRSEIGVLYISNFNRKPIEKLFEENELSFTELIRCKAYVYLWKGHPLADEPSISLEQLEPYPCLSFEQNGKDGYIYAEEILSENIYPRMIKATDRAAMGEMMKELYGYTLCSGILCKELGGDDYRVVPFREDTDNPNSIMEIGYICKKNGALSEIGQTYISELKKSLAVNARL